ncbi:taste receptor type 2 member 42 [Physeter macrocephalus]|uniref:Taste receptor type 2 n=1 Tax=Physeter macrocephalus TaxID=9755 RepID=A0A2Y9T8H2_PHYMC|nr:taste receptor type 2 member 42 [Physeter catodon]|eukprot:XP_023985100.1 taste receptor type 2 member 42 [Physeter catodon]
MPSGVENTFLAEVIGEFMTGMLGNGFIVLVNCIDWVKRPKFSSADCILTGLASSRISQLWKMLFDSFVLVLWAHLYAIDKLAKNFWTLSNHLATWFATCLSVFCLFKVASSSHPCFTWLRWQIHRVVLVLLMGSLFLLFLNFELVDAFNGVWTNVYKIYERNSTWPSDVSKTLYLDMLIFTFICLIPFLLSLTSLLCLFLSLMRHTRNLQLSPSSKDFSIEAHKRAMKMVMSFLLLFMVHVSSILLTGWVFLKLQKHQANLVVMLTLTLFPSGHSFILILANSKLRQNALGLLWYLNCHLKKVKPLAS